MFSRASEPSVSSTLSVVVTSVGVASTEVSTNSSTTGLSEPSVSSSLSVVVTSVEVASTEVSTNSSATGLSEADSLTIASGTVASTLVSTRLVNSSAATDGAPANKKTAPKRTDTVPILYFRSEKVSFFFITFPPSFSPSLLAKPINILKHKIVGIASIF